MEKFSHTPGPWVAEADQSGNVEIFSRPPGGYTMLIAEAFAEDMGNELPQRTNATLIAAAPELLGALRGLVGYCEGSGWDRRQVLDTARAAIAKARGEKS